MSDHVNLCEQAKKNELKNAQISETIKKTRQRRTSQATKTYELKVDMGHTSAGKESSIYRTFLEGKWIYNDALSQNEPGKYIPGKTVMVKNRDGEMEERQLTTIGSQAKQSVITELKNNLSSLSALKDNGHKVGKLKFKRDMESITFKQYGTSHKVDCDKGRVRLQGIGWLKVYGLEQIDLENMEIGPAKLIKRASGYYIKLTVFIDKSLIDDEFTPGTEIGMDMGVATHITLSTGEKISVLVAESPRLRRIQKSLSRQYAHAYKEKKRLGLEYLPTSKRMRKNLVKLRKEYEKLGHKKDNLAYQICSRLLKNEHVYYQDESLASWKRRYGSKLHHSVLGRIKDILARNPRAVMIDKCEPTTKKCLVCGEITPIPLSQRVFTCSHCGYSDDRDFHSADRMVQSGKKHVPVERRELTHVLVGEDDYFSQLDYVNYVHVVRGTHKVVSCSHETTSSMKRETNPSSAGC